MSEIKFDSEFYENVDKFIRLANDISKAVGDERCAAALNFAASRYSAYLVASSSLGKGELEKLRKEAANYFCPIYMSNLERNLDYFEKNYESSIQKFRNT